MVEHQVDHQIMVTGQAPDIGPVAQLRVDLAVVDHREAVVAAPGEEGQHMDTAEDGLQALAKELIEHRQGALVGIQQGVAVDDQPLVLLAPERLACTMTVPQSGPLRFDQAQQTAQDLFAACTIERREQLCGTLAKVVGFQGGEVACHGVLRRRRGALPRERSPFH